MRQRLNRSPTVSPQPDNRNIRPQEEKYNLHTFTALIKKKQETGIEVESEEVEQQEETANFQEIVESDDCSEEDASDYLSDGSLSLLDSDL